MPKPDAKRIRLLRQQRGLKIIEFARKSSIARSTAHNIECNGQATSIEVLWRIARVLGVDDVEDLIVSPADPSESTVAEVQS